MIERGVLFVQFTDTICCWFGVTGSHDMEDIEILYINIFMPSNLMTVPKSVSSDSVRDSGR